MGAIFELEETAFEVPCCLYYSYVRRSVHTCIEETISNLAFLAFFNFQSWVESLRQNESPLGRSLPSSKEERPVKAEREKKIGKSTPPSIHSYLLYYDMLQLAGKLAMVIVAHLS